MSFSSVNDFTQYKKLRVGLSKGSATHTFCFSLIPTMNTEMTQSLLWRYLLSALVWIMGCLGETPLLTLDPFAGGCPRDGIDTVYTTAALDWNDVQDPRLYYGVFFEDSKQTKVSEKDFITCPDKSTPVICTDPLASTRIMTVEYNATAQKKYSEVNMLFRLISAEEAYFSNYSRYPLVKDCIKEALTIDGVVVPLGSDNVTNTTGIAALSYNVTGVLLANLAFVKILDSSYNVLAQETNRSEVSTEVKFEGKYILYVTYNTTNGCSSGTTGYTKVILEGPESPKWYCGRACVSGIAAAVIAAALTVGCCCCKRRGTTPNIDYDVPETDGRYSNTFPDDGAVEVEESPSARDANTDMDTIS